LAFGINREELRTWKQKVKNGEIAIITHFWQDKRFPSCTSVTKVGCNNIEKLIAWGKKYRLQSDWIHMDETFPHFDLFGKKQLEVLRKEKMYEQIERFSLEEKWG